MKESQEKDCPICNSKSIFVYMEGIYDSESTKVMECCNCGVQFLDPMMTKEEEEEYYKNYHESQKSRNYKKFTLKDIQKIRLKHYEEYYDIYYKLVNDAKTILEIGSGSGGFLKFIKKYFSDKDITSVEMSQSNLNFLKNNFDDIRFYSDIKDVKSHQFDLIVGLGVLEHVRDVIHLLKMLNTLLRDTTSKLVFNIPNKRNPLIEIYGIEEFRNFNYMKQHCYTFSETSLEILASKTGYEIERINYLQVYGLDNHISWLKNKEPRDFSKYTKLFSNSTLESYKKDLIEQKITDLMMLILKKTPYQQNKV